MKYRTTGPLTGTLLALLLLAGCGSSENATAPTVDDRFAHAKTTFDRGNYVEAINEFTVITLQYQGSQYASQAQYYLGECRYNRGEYLLAAFEYGLLKRSYPASPKVADAQYKLAMSYYMMSPRWALDQQYTKKAIDEFQSFVEYFPSNPLAADADAKIRELNTKLARKLYEAAKQYLILEYYKAAMLYFDDVIEKYHDTEYAPLSYLEKAEVLIDRSRYGDAGVVLERFMTRYPNSVLRGRADALKERLEKFMRNYPAPLAKPKPGPLTSESLPLGGR